MKEGLNPYLENFQVSSTLHDRPLADRASISETVKNARDGEISWALDPLRTFRESTINKVSISDHTLNFFPVVPTNFFLYERCWLISHILGCSISFQLISLSSSRFL